MKQMRAELLGLARRHGTASGVSGTPGTKIFPVLQHAGLQISQESEVVTQLCGKEHIDHSEVCIATPYANFRPHFLRTLVESAAVPGSALTLTVPTVPAHGFGSAKGMLRFVPALHHYALHTPLHRLLRASSASARPNVHVRYFMQPGCTYHSKGIWVFPRSEPFSGDPLQRDAQPISGPVTTYIGSSNFSERSWGRDFELGFVLTTRDPSLKGLLRREHANLQAHCGIAAEGALADNAGLPPFTCAGMGTVPRESMPQFRAWQRRGLFFVARVLRSIL
jgi:CDP-diacylglycerol--glycerol-3-phosphate 3-phosphatidyltransferase